MEAITNCPEYSIEKVSLGVEANCISPKIEKALQLEIQDSDVRCMKGDCCKDCSNNWYGG